MVSVAILSKEQYNDWLNGLIYYCPLSEDFLSKDEAIKYNYDYIKNNYDYWSETSAFLKNYESDSNLSKLYHDYSTLIGNSVNDLYISQEDYDIILEGEDFCKEYTTENGDTVVAFGISDGSYF